MMNKQIVLVTMFVILLNSCAPNASQNATTTLVSTVTSTPLPTFTPTITSTPTETPDPNKPVDATGKDAQGNYIKVENGVTYTWETNVPTGDNGETMKGFFKSMLVANAVDQPGDGYNPIIKVDIRVKQGIDVPTLTHIEFTGSSDALDYSRLFWTNLMERALGKSILRMSTAEQVTFANVLYGVDPAKNGNISIPVTLASGKTVNLPINSNTHFIIRLVDQSDIPNPDWAGATMVSVTSIDPQTSIGTITVASTSDLKAYSDQDWAELLLLPFHRIIVEPDLSQKFWNNNIGLDQLVAHLDGQAIRDPNPFFVISHTSSNLPTPTP